MKDESDSTLRSEFEALSDEERKCLLDYLNRGPSEGPLDIQSEDEPFAKAWRSELENLPGDSGAFLNVLRAAYPALHFAVSAQTCESEEYRAAVQQGVFPAQPVELPDAMLVDPLVIELFETAAGCIPVLKMPRRDDFVWLLNCFTSKNRPDPVPPTQGASFLSGLVNWGRLNGHRENWMKLNPFGNWAGEWKRVRSRDNWEFRDRVILVTSGLYGGISSELADLSDADELSMRIRVEHECVHYCYRRWRGSVSGTLSEEIVADFVALREVLGDLEETLLPRVLGLDQPSSSSPRFLTYIPEDLKKEADLIRRIALSGCRELHLRYAGEWFKEKAVRELEQWSLGKHIESLS